MKIGILTFHSQLNYGGVLQCLALQTVLKRMGHETVVIDRRLYPEPTMFGGITRRLNMAGWGMLVLRGLLFCGGLAWIRRCRSTERFIRQNLTLTSYHFHTWSNAPKDLGVDLVVVGSDQVWNPGKGWQSEVYLLEEASNVPAIAYAASFGCTKLSSDISMDDALYKKYVSGLSHFRKISCREKEGVEICQRLGFVAEHVADPTLLCWYGRPEVLMVNKESRKKRLICYFMSEDIESACPLLERFATLMHCTVEVYVNSALRPMPKSLRKLFFALRDRIAQTINHRVKLKLFAGPMEFLDSLHSATWVVSDSFHALMFSLIYRRNIRILEPSLIMRKAMFGRILEFSSHMNGNLIVSNLSQALDSFALGQEVQCDEAWLSNFVTKSRVWLESAVQER